MNMVIVKLSDQDPDAPIEFVLTRKGRLIAAAEMEGCPRGLARALIRHGLMALAAVLLAGCTASPGHAATEPSAGYVRTGKGWETAGIQGPIPGPGTCHYRHNTTGDLLPDPACTPGAIDVAVTDRDLNRTVCRKGGYTASVRPPRALTDAIKMKILAAYGIPERETQNYELDHLIELAAGGSSDVRNLWPQPDTTKRYPRSQYVRNDKDVIEAYTFHAACAGIVKLSDVQRKMSTNWTTAIEQLQLKPIPAGYTG
jgi:DMSO/TMAO reductase YedYZ molybdopterin-dependent catalytic subunit